MLSRLIEEYNIIPILYSSLILLVHIPYVKLLQQHFILFEDNRKWLSSKTKILTLKYHENPDNNSVSNIV